MPVAQRLVGAACQDRPGVQEGLEATPRVWRDEEQDSDPQAAHEPGQQSSPVPAAVCQAQFLALRLQGEASRPNLCSFGECVLIGQGVETVSKF